MQGRGAIIKVTDTSVSLMAAHKRATINPITPNEISRDAFDIESWRSLRGRLTTGHGGRYLSVSFTGRFRDLIRAHLRRRRAISARDV